MRLISLWLPDRTVSANVFGVNSIALDASSPHRLLRLHPPNTLAQPPGRVMQAGVAGRTALDHSARDGAWCGACGGACAVSPLSARHDMLGSIQRQATFNPGTTCACRCRQRPRGPSGNRTGFTLFIARIYGTIFSFQTCWLDSLRGGA